MTDKSREAFEEMYHPGFFHDPKALAWEAWKGARKYTLEEVINLGSTLHGNSLDYFVDRLMDIKDAK